MVRGRNEEGADPVVPVERPAPQEVESRAGRDGLGNEVCIRAAPALTIKRMRGEVWDLPQGQGSA